MAITNSDARCKGFFNKLTFGWMNKTAKQALTQDLELDELPLPSELLSEAAYNEFQGNWEAAVKAGDPNLKRVILKTFGKDLFLAGLFKLAWSVALLLGAFFFIRSLQDFVANRAPFNRGVWQGWLLAVGFFVDAYCLGMLLQRMFYGCMTTGVRIKGALINAVTKKSFQMHSIDKEHAAECVSFVASDINKVYDGCQDIHFLWTAPIEAGGILTILAILIGVYAFPGWGVVFVVLPAQYLFGWMIIKNKLANSKFVNERSTIFQELLPAMKLVKYYAWERFFEKEVSDIRKKELRIQRNNAWIKTINIMMVFGTPPAAATAIFACYEVFAGQLNNAGSLPFTALALFNVLRFPLVVLPKALRGLSEAIASLSRIQAFLLLDVEHRERNTGTSRVGVDMRNCTFKHIRDKGFTLEVPEFNVKSGELVAVVGRVGAGKSSLISAILGNMDVISGQTTTGGKISYVPQNAWCQALSVRENIMFGMPADDEWYRQVIHDCALELDLQILPKGDLSPVGLRGINLSGGQRQRVNLARAAYFNGDLVLLDNALSAVDHHTANHIFDNLLKNSLRDKAIVLITHQVEFLPKCDKVAIMDSGKMLYFGPFTAEAQRLLSQVLPTSHLLAATGGAEERKQAPKKKVASQDSSNLSLSATNIKDQVTKKSAGELTTYSLTTAMWTYAVAGGAILLTLSTFFFMTAQASRQFSDVWIRGWTTNTVFNLPGTVGWYGSDKPNPPGSRPQVGDPNVRVAGLPGGYAYVLVYGLIGGVAFWSLMFFRGWTFQGWCRRAGQDLHRNAVHNVLFAPLGFFLRNPVGELLVAFTKENDIMDEALIDTMHYVGIYGLIILSTVITVSITIPMFAVFGGVLLLVTLVLLRFYLPAASKLKSMRISTAGAVVGLVAEVLEGLPVINAFDHNRYFVQRAAYLVDQHHRAQFNSDSLNLWLSFYADLYGALLIFGVCIFAVVQRQTLGASAAGLAFSNTIQMLVFYSWTVRGCADTISQFASVEKIAWLARETPQEGDEYIGDGTNATAKEQKKNSKALALTGKPPQGWPSTGVIEYDNVWMKYGPACPYALKGVTFRIEHSEKVGVVGRTGSGKSTLLLALYRMFELDKGTIKVDGVDVATLKLRELRPKLSVIPQEPVVFSGTVRTNLDPFSEFQDVQLWEVLKKVGLESQVKMTGGLDGKVDGTGGQAWSLGQQQLVCLARAALRNVPILCLDEATASLDPHTEQEVQRIIKKIFEPRTTLTIAHRLDTVIESDQVLVMEAGVLKEMGPSKTLLDNPNSMFSALVDKTGAQAASALRQVAADYFAMRAATSGTRATGFQY